jgi:hypothetical protein
MGLFRQFLEGGFCEVSPSGLHLCPSNLMAGVQSVLCPSLSHRNTSLSYSTVPEDSAHGRCAYLRRSIATVA